MTGNYPIQISDSLWVLGNHFFNHYLIAGSQAAALVEMGMSATVDRLIGQLEGIGVEPDYLIVTHPHADHLTGMAGLLERYPKSVMVAGDGAREFALHPKAAPAMAFEDSYVSSRLAERGIRPGRKPVKNIRFPGDDQSVIVARSSEIDLGGISIRCSLVTGHSPGNILIEVPGENALLVSDSLGFHYPGRGFLPLFFTGYTDFIETLDHLETKKPAFIGPGHSGPIIGNRHTREAIHQARQTADSLRHRVMAHRKTPEKLVDQLFREYYVDEFSLYSEKNIRNCMHLLVKRVLQLS